MKKITLLLFIIVANISFGQTTLATKLKITGNVTDNAATKVNVQDATGLVNTIAKADLIDVIEKNDVPSLPLTGETGKIYLVKNVNKIYRWNGTFYQELAITDISGKQDVLNEDNLGTIIDGLTYKLTPMDGDGFLMRDVLTGLAVEVPFSTVQPKLVSGTNIKTIEGQNLLGSGNIDINKADVGLANVDNTSDVNKPVSTSQQNALDLKANISGQVFTGAISATNLSGNNTGDETTLSIQTKRPLKTLDSVSIEGVGNVIIPTKTHALTHELGGTDVIHGENLSVNVIPPTNNYSPVTSTLKGHLQGIDQALGSVVQTTAGLTNRIYYTADVVNVSGINFYTSSANNKGIVSEAVQTVINGDNTKSYFAQDIISVPQPFLTTAPAGSFAGQLSVRVDDDSAQERYTIEIYKTNNSGIPIASGVTGAPIGSLGVTVVAILDSGIIDLVQNSTTNVTVSGLLNSSLTLNVGERLRYHISAEKIGIAGGNFSFSLYLGNAHNSYYDVPVTFNTDTVLNRSLVSGITTSDALNNLNANKEDVVNKVTDIATGANNTTYPTSLAVKTYADNLVVGMLKDNGNWDASVNLFPTTNKDGGAIEVGDMWYVSIAGTLGGKAVNVGDSFRALVNTPAQIDSNWSVLESNIGYVPANDLDVVHKTGIEVITGSKSFTMPVKFGNGTLSSPSISFYDEISGDTGFNHVIDGEIDTVVNGMVTHKNELNKTSSYVPFEVNDSFSVNGKGSNPGVIYIDGGQIGHRKYALRNSITGLSNSGLEIRDETGGFTPFYITDSGKSNFNFPLTASPATVDTELATLGQAKALASSGTYTPISSSLINITSTSGLIGKYVKIGNMISLQVEIQAIITTAATASSLIISLPFALKTSTTPKGLSVLSHNVSQDWVPAIVRNDQVYFKPNLSGGYTIVINMTYETN